MTKEECLRAVKEMERNKTPGSDGLPAEFYKVFWKDVSDFLINSYNCAYLCGHLSVSENAALSNLSQIMTVNFILLQIGSSISVEL